jgi:hypothetical protein
MILARASGFMKRSMQGVIILALTDHFANGG